MTFGENLKAFREELKLPRKTVAKEIGVSIATYANYENDKREPNLKTLKALSRTLLVYVDNLITGVGTPKYFDDETTAFIDEYGHSPEDDQPLKVYNAGSDFFKNLGYEQIDSPIEIIVPYGPTGNPTYYFVNKNDEYDYFPITSDELDDLTKQQLYEKYQNKDIKKIFQEHIDHWHRYEAYDKYQKWLDKAEEIAENNYRTFPRVYDKNQEIANAFLKEQGQDDPYVLSPKQRDKYIKLQLDARAAAKEIYEKYRERTMEEDFDSTLHFKILGRK